MTLVKLGPDETALLGRLAGTNPGYVKLDDCDRIALNNLANFGCAEISGHRAWITPVGLNLWDTRTPVTQEGDTNP